MMSNEGVIFTMANSSSKRVFTHLADSKLHFFQD